MNTLHPIMAQAMRPWILPVCEDPRHSLLLEADDLEPEEPDTEPVICNACAGSGEGRAGPWCDKCDGRGEVTE